MRSLLELIVLLQLAWAVTATPLLDLTARALPANSPHGYAPHSSKCPSSKPKIRTASSLSDQEQSWLPTRRAATIQPMKNFLKRADIPGLDIDKYFQGQNHTNLPNVAIAISGGGYRAMLNGAGVLEAFDSRTPGSTASRQVGGLLQSATYLAGLSGGSWLVGSLYTNNFTSINDILTMDTATKNPGGVWQFTNSIFEGPDTGIQAVTSAEYYADLLSDVKDKKDAGFDVSITDYWGRALSYQLVNASDGGPAYTFSSIARQDWFTSGTTPLPFIVTDYRAPGQVLVSANTTIFDIDPWEFGSPDPTMYAFAPLEYIGTNFTAGKPTSDMCVTGYDNVGFVMGTSSTLFNAVVSTFGGNNSGNFLEKALRKALEALVTKFSQSDIDISIWRPNPFYLFNKGTNENALDEQLSLVDGGEDNQNIPFHPLIQPNRHIDVIFAVDSSADTNASFPTKNSAENWPAGLAIIATYKRSLATISNGTAFPKIPSANTFINLGLNNRPTFFGCNVTTKPTPLILYLPNAPYTFNSNVSTFNLSYTDTQRNALVKNGYNLATQLNGTLDSEWSRCVGCAMLSRSFHRTGTKVPQACRQCFSRYCWNGTVDDRTPANYVPVLKSG